jgi:hypothetical protein
MFEFAIKLLLTHFIGDFLLQPQKWVKGREKKKLKSKYLYYHMGIHILLISPFLFYDFKLYWSGITVIIVSHFLIDLAKSYITKRKNEALLFITDQLAHLFVIALVINAYHEVPSIEKWILAPKMKLIGLMLLLTTKVASIIIKVLVSRWAPELTIQSTNQTDKDESLQNAGTYIGMMERLLIILFIYKGFWEGIGYLLAAKSVFRIGDLTKSTDKKQTEYILIGTMISFLIAIGIGVVFKYSLEKLI